MNVTNITSESNYIPGKEMVVGTIRASQVGGIPGQVPCLL